MFTYETDTIDRPYTNLPGRDAVRFPADLEGLMNDARSEKWSDWHRIECLDQVIRECEKTITLMEGRFIPQWERCGWTNEYRHFIDDIPNVRALIVEARELRNGFEAVHA